MEDGPTFFWKGKDVFFLFRGMSSLGAQRIGGGVYLPLKCSKEKHIKLNKMYLKQKPNPPNAYIMEDSPKVHDDH